MSQQTCTEGGIKKHQNCWRSRNVGQRRNPSRYQRGNSAEHTGALRARQDGRISCSHAQSWLPIHLISRFFPSGRDNCWAHRAWKFIYPSRQKSTSITSARFLSCLNHPRSHHKKRKSRQSSHWLSFPNLSCLFGLWTKIWQKLASFVKILKYDSRGQEELSLCWKRLSPDVQLFSTPNLAVHTKNPPEDAEVAGSSLD